MAKLEAMKIVNPNAAGIDIGSRSHFVAIGQSETDVREFGVYSSDVETMISYLREHEIATIAMESTGSYWQSLFLALQDAGFEVILVNGYQTKNVRAKTDVKDCQWIQKLHSLGLLRGCFLPDEQTARIRTLHRHRQSLVEEAAKMINKMQKALRLMNLRLDVVLSDIVGKSGKQIIEAIIGGQRDGTQLSLLVDGRVQKTKQQIADALVGQWNDELLYELEDCYDLYKRFQEKIEICDKKIEALLKIFTEKVVVSESSPKITRKEARSKNQVQFNLPDLSYRFYDVDLFAIECISVNTVLTLISDIGQGIYRFPSAKHFVSFLRLAPNNRISGGKIVNSRTPKGCNRFAFCLRNAANSMDRVKNSALGRFFKRVAYKKGRGAAITATARKLAVIIWNMIVKKQPYAPMELESYDLMIRNKSIKRVKKLMASANISVGELISP